MTIPPVVIGQSAQPLSGSGPPPPLNRPQYVIFQGRLGSQEHFIEVLAGEAGATPSAGYAKWARVPRPQRKALTIHEGYEPMALTVPVRFDAVRNNGVREDVEDQIQWLEWMGGRGIKPGAQGVGQPPLVVVYAAKGAEREVPLIPKPFQTANIKWFVDDLIFDANPLRSAGGARIRQDCEVRLVEHVVDPVIPGGPTSTAYKTFKTTGSLNTLKKLVAHYLHGSRSRLAEAVRETVKANAFNRKIGTNPEKHLAVGTHIRIPEKFLHV